MRRQEAWSEWAGKQSAQFWRDVSDLLAGLEAAQQRLAECYRLTGADPDGNTDAALAEHAVTEVRRLREEHDQGEHALTEARAEIARLTEALKGLHRYTITSEGASPGYFRLVEDVKGAWLQWTEVEALAGAAAPRKEQDDDGHEVQA